MLVRKDVAADIVPGRASHSGVTPYTTRLPPIVLFLIGQGFPACSPPPISVTFALTVIPFSKTVFAPQATTLPLTVMCELSGPLWLDRARMSRHMSHRIRARSPGRESRPERPERRVRR